MNNIKNIGIDITENGYIINAGKKKYVFDDIKNARKWIEDNLSLTGENKQFIDALDDEEGVDGDEVEDSTTTDSWAKLVDSLEIGNSVGANNV